MTVTPLFVLRAVVGTTLFLFFAIGIGDNIIGCAENVTKPETAQIIPARYHPLMDQYQIHLRDLFDGSVMSTQFPYYDEDSLLVTFNHADELTDGDKRRLAILVYNGFVSVRRDAQISNPENCVVHISDDTGKDQASDLSGNVSP